MSATQYFWADLHLRHSRILDFAGAYRSGTTVEEHDEWIIHQINSTCTKRDALYILGDIAFNLEGLALLKHIRCNVIMVLGNHDRFKTEEYLKYGHIKPGLYKLSKRGQRFWLSHAPIHPRELRGRPNIHGHVHYKTIDDHRYFNVSVEATGRPVSIHEIKTQLISRQTDI